MCTLSSRSLISWSPESDCSPSPSFPPSNLSVAGKLMQRWDIRPALTGPMQPRKDSSRLSLLVADAGGFSTSWRTK